MYSRMLSTEGRNPNVNKIFLFELLLHMSPWLLALIEVDCLTRLAVIYQNRGKLIVN